jgi:hypothetical protein
VQEGGVCCHKQLLLKEVKDLGTGLPCYECKVHEINEAVDFFDRYFGFDAAGRGGFSISADAWNILSVN